MTELDKNSIEYDIYAVIGEWLVSQLQGHDDAAYAIFEAIVPRYNNPLKPNPVMHKCLTHVLLQHVTDETSDELEARIRARMHPALLALLDARTTKLKGE